MHLHAIISKNASLMQGSQPIITADLTCLECELGVPSVACMHSNKQQGERQFGNLHTKDIKAGAFNLFHEQCPLCASYQIVSHPVVYVNACKQPMVLLAHTQGKSNLR